MPSAPRPTSSSVVNMTFTSPWGLPLSMSLSTADIISATPALSSAPSSVVPSVTISSSPTCFERPGQRASFMTTPDSKVNSPSGQVITAGRTFSPGASGAVSTWAMSAMEGAPLTLAGSVPYTLLLESKDMSFKPSSSISRASSRISSF